MTYHSPNIGNTIIGIKTAYPLAVKGVEIEPHLCYYRKRGVQEHRLQSQMGNPGSKGHRWPKHQEFI